jgi:hypothetical protein
MKKKDKRNERRRTIKKKRMRMTATPSDPVAPHFLFGA